MPLMSTRDGRPWQRRRSAFMGRFPAAIAFSTTRDSNEAQPTTVDDPLVALRLLQMGIVVIVVGVALRGMPVAGSSLFVGGLRRGQGRERVVDRGHPVSKTPTAPPLGSPGVAAAAGSVGSAIVVRVRRSTSGPVYA